VVIGNERFVDGAFTNSIPADLVKGMGADYIVGIDLANHEAKPSLLSRLFPTYKSKIKEPWAKGYEFSDVMLHPDLSDFQATSYRRGKEMFDIGYHHAMSFISKIKQDIDKLKNPTKNVNK
jgi:NTE family protein